MTEPLAPQYNPSAIESELYAWWQARGLFAPDAGPGGSAATPYVLMMPPPNVTAVLHMGHGLNNTVQDVLVRFERMRGRRTLWLPGTDHAGIATQNVVERMLAKEGLTRFDVGRDAFVERVWAYVRETGAAILEQLKAIGSSADWSRTYFTLDEDLSRAVREAFVSLYEDGLVYRGHYIINWCPRCLTALSNEEAEKEETDGKIWHLRYPLADGSGHVTVATTRPETMLGDTAVAVHPDDERYRHLIGRTLRLPVVDREVPIVADDAVDPAFGSGAVKVTPAHDPADFEIGRRHGLPSIDVMTPEARISLAAPDRFQGLDRYEARSRVVAEFEAAGLLDRVEPHRHAVGHCYRCETVVEPRLSDQWFVRMEPLARPALARYRDGTLRFIPERRGDDYTQWLEGIRDWCISRQLWWGHRIPVWYCDADGCGRIAVSRTDLAACPACGGPVRQDEDVLDTWFSSWLVPVLQPGLARAHGRSGRLLSGPHAGLRPRDPVLLGRPDDHVRALLHGRRAVHPHVPARHGAGHAAPQDVEVARQRHRPAGGGGAVWRGRAPLLAGVGHVGRDRRHPRSRRPRGVLRAGPELRQQAVERGAVHPLEPRRPAAAARRRARRGPARRADAGRPLDHRAVRRDRPRGHRGLREVPPERGHRRRLPLPLERSGRLVHRADQATPLRRHPRRRRGPGGGHADVRRGAPPAPSGHAVRDRGALATLSRPLRRSLDLRRAVAPAGRARRRRPGTGRVRPGPAGRGRDPGDPRGIRRPAGADGARLREPGRARARPRSRAGARHGRPAGQAFRAACWGRAPTA